MRYKSSHQKCTPTEDRMCALAGVQKRLPFDRPQGLKALSGSKSVEDVVYRRALGLQRASLPNNQRALTQHLLNHTVDHSPFISTLDASPRSQPFPAINKKQGTSGRAATRKMFSASGSALGCTKSTLALLRLSSELPVLTLVPPMDAEVEELLAHVNNLAKQVEIAEEELLAIQLTRAKQQSCVSGGECVPELEELGTHTLASRAPAQLPCKRHGGLLGGNEVWDSAIIDQDHQLMDSALIKVGRVILKLEIAHGLAADKREEHKYHMAIMTQAVMRGFLCRSRHARCVLMLQRQRSYLFDFMLQTARFEVLRQQMLDAVVNASSTEREVRCTQRCFEAWHNEALAQREHVDYIRAASRAAAAKRESALLRMIVRAWRKDCAGPQSTRNCHWRHAEALRAARIRVQEREDLLRAGKEAIGQNYEYLIITNDMVNREVSRTIYRVAQGKQIWWCLRHHFLALWHAVRMDAAASAVAVKHYRNTTYARIFYPWTEHLHTSPIATLDRKRWLHPRCYMPRYSQRLVDRFTRKRVRQYLVQPFWTYWRQHYEAWASGRALRGRCDTRNRLAHWTRWREAVARRRNLRSAVVDAWHETGRQLLARPLRAWYLYARTRRMRRMDQKRLVATHARARERRLRQKLMRAWHHQAVYGRVEGLYTRAELVRSLAELQAHGRRLEARAEAHAAACEDATKRLEDERNRAKRAAARLKDRDDHATRMTLAIHHAEAEIERIGSAIECVAKLHPNAARTALIRSLKEQDAYDGVREANKNDKSRKLPFKPESFLHELVREDTDLVETNIAAENKDKDAQVREKNPYEDSKGNRLDNGVDIGREVLMLRIRFVLDQASADFRTFSHFGGKMLYNADRQDDDLDTDAPPLDAATQEEVWRSASRDDAVDKVLKMARDLKEGWQMWDFLINGDVSILGEKHAIAWKDMEGVAIDINAKWAPLKTGTLSGPRRLATWGEFLRALNHPGQQAL